MKDTKREPFPKKKATPKTPRKQKPKQPPTPPKKTQDKNFFGVARAHQ